MSRTVADLSPIVAPGDTVYVALLNADGTPTRTGYSAVVGPDGDYTGRAKVTAGRARVETVNRPGRR
ncbi:hypothetical protein H4696_009768 [Amycolatopsis lexingtonensis]|uniref:Uncharacterized protein n=1 Tax=Amycolatopsis lexingtonensis TaxID=218822 RepID=A0ABR9IHM7_9PSEU|nr:hypothetical protein [Amycolatopsis lexingtonensis]MBE1502668.1 hypothetical protein [Amycolatopsis lexingtonensis]